MRALTAVPARGRGESDRERRSDQEERADQEDRTASPRRRAVLDAVRGADRPPGVAEVAAQLAVHPNTARFHLDVLVARGAVERRVEKPSGRGRPRTVYAARPGMDRGGERRYRLLARMLLGGPAAGRDSAGCDPAGSGTDSGSGPGPGAGPGSGSAADPRAAAAAGTGRAWGRALVGPAPAGVRRPTARQAVGTVTAMLADLGFDPQPPARGRGPVERIRLRHCPFLELAEEHGQIVCSLHLGLVQGALAELRSPVAATRIEPFAEPGACLAHLAPAPAPRPG